MRLSSEDDVLHRSSPGTPAEMRQTSQATVVDPALIRPSVYYNDGPFDAPGSSDEEAESLLDDDDKDRPDSPGMAELGLGSARSTVDGRSMRSPLKQGTSASLRWLIIGLVGLVGLAVGIGFIAAVTYTDAPLVQGLRKLTMDHIFNGTFSARTTQLNWVPEAGDGVFSVSTDGSINLVSLSTNSTRKLVDLADIRDEQGNSLAIADWKVSPDMHHILVKADYRKQWRHSSFGNYYVHNLETKQTWPIIPPSSPSKTAYATWSPTGEAIAYVVENDLYVIPTADPSAEHIRVTTTGNATFFHGVPDWVYEEEVFSGDHALWFSPDSSKIAFLSFDETEVPEFTFPIYNPTEDATTVNPYTTEVVMKYPKPGYPNPIVSVHVFDLERYLFYVYGGPFSQQVDARWPRTAWSNYLAAGLGYIVVSVDGRGTGYKGRKLRNPVKNNLGFFETIDQIEAARQYVRKPYVDSKRIGIWGWSYGGFMSSKVVEANEGVHTLAMAVAPVTSWLLYDTIYTERYMNLPALNPGGYVNASISNVTGFHNVDYLLAHGSGDDNVHYSNSAHLLDMFTQAKVRKYRFRMFTDSDHSIARRGANREVYEYLTAFLEEKWGKGPKRRG